MCIKSLILAEYSYGERVVQIRRFIHEQTRSRQPNRLLDWWQLVKDVSEAMSTMDFNFSFRNAIQLRSYNQFKTQEKKLKKELERSLADLTTKMEKQAQSTSDLTGSFRNFCGKDVDSHISKIVEDHKYEMSLIIEKYNQEHQTLINQKK